jgi:hypothetical protein
MKRIAIVAKFNMSNSVTQLNPPIPIETPKGKALAHFLIDYGPEYDLLWISFDDATGECWTWHNHSIRAQDNISIGRKYGGNKPK